MRLPYSTHPELSDKRPTLRITLQYRRNRKIINALADTGADGCVFESEIGESLGIDITSGRKGSMRGIGNVEYPIYFHRITLFVGNFRLRAEVAFTDTPGRPSIPILGHNGFFEHFKVTLNFSQQYIEIVPTSNSVIKI